MLFAEVGDVVWQALIAGVVTIILAWMQQRTRAVVQATAKAAAAEVSEVKETLAETTKNQDGKLTAIHTLVNSNRGETLLIASVALDRVAQLTGHPKDVEAAVVARKLLQEHEAQQKIVDESKRKDGHVE